MTEPDKPTPSLYEWAGGEPAIRRLMDSFYDRVERDELLGPRFFPDGVHEQHRTAEVPHRELSYCESVLSAPAEPPPSTARRSRKSSRVISPSA